MGHLGGNRKNEIAYLLFNPNATIFRTFNHGKRTHQFLPL